MLTQRLPIPPILRGDSMPDERIMFCVRVDPDLAERIRDASYWDRVNITIIIDTGATYTTIPSNVAEELGYDLTLADSVRLTTAAGIINAPLLQVESINVQGYAVRNIRVVVLPTGVGPREGLLGLNFLKHFKYTVDASRNEFRIERP